MIDVSIIIINYKTPELTINCVDSIHTALEKWSGCYEIIVVDNDSQDGSAERLSVVTDERTLIFLSGRNGGFAYGNNFGASKAKGKYLFFLNSDTLLYSDVLPEMIVHMDADASIGAMTCQMVDGDEVPLVVGHSFENVQTLIRQTVIKPLLPQWLYCLWRKRKVESVQNRVAEADWVSGAGMLVQKTLFQDVGGWNERFFMYMEDEELCAAIRQRGDKCCIYPRLGVKHLIGKSGGSHKIIIERYKSGMLYFSSMQEKPLWLIKRLLLLQAKRDAKRGKGIKVSELVKELRAHEYDYDYGKEAPLLRRNSFIQ